MPQKDRAGWANRYHGDTVMAVIALLSDRLAGEVVPAIEGLQLDVKTEPLSVHAYTHALAMDPEAVLVDAAENPGQGYAVLSAIADAGTRVPMVAIVERGDVERFAWDEVAEELLYPGAPEAELRVRFAMLRRRHGASEGAVIRLGPLALDTETYRATMAGQTLDLTFKEFELLRFLASSPGRVFTRPALLRQVWGYDFYGGTRTVDVHVRRLRAKLGPEREHLVETVRSVGYRAAELDR